MFPVNKQYREIIYYRAYGSLKSDASRTYLSFLWWIIDPILSMLVYYIVFGLILKVGEENYVPFLIIGLIVWAWFSKSVIQSSNILAREVNLICQVNFPKIILPSVIIFNNAIKFFVVFLLLQLFLLFFQIYPSTNYIYLPIILLAQYFFILVCCYSFSLLIAFIPDFNLILPNIFRLLFFLSGVFYDFSSIPEEYRLFFKFNPMAVLIDSYRTVFLLKNTPDLYMLFIIIASSLFLLAIISCLYYKLDKSLPRVLMSR